MDKDELLQKAWKKTHGIHSCRRGEFGLEIVDFDGRTLWVNLTCSCGAKQRLEFQLTEITSGEWKEGETGAVRVDLATGKVI